MRGGHVSSARIYVGERRVRAIDNAKRTAIARERNIEEAAAAVVNDDRSPVISATGPRRVPNLYMYMYSGAIVKRE